MAYRFTDISVKPIYRLFQKYRLSVSVKAWTDKISVIIGYRQRENIGYRLSAKAGTNKKSVIGYRLWPNIGYRLSVKFNRYAIPGRK